MWTRSKGKPVFCLSFVDGRRSTYQSGGVNFKAPRKREQTHAIHILPYVEQDRETHESVCVVLFEPVLEAHILCTPCRFLTSVQNMYLPFNLVTAAGGGTDMYRLFPVLYSSKGGRHHSFRSCVLATQPSNAIIPVCAVPLRQPVQHGDILQQFLWTTAEGQTCACLMFVFRRTTGRHINCDSASC